MKITDEMIHPDIRRQGALLRKLYRFKNPKSFFHAQKIIQFTKGFIKPKNLTVKEYTIQTKDNSGLRLCTYQRNQTAPNGVGLLWLHGGGFAMGTPEQDLPFIQGFLKMANCVIIAPDYRCSTQQPYPAAFNDAYNTLLWMKTNAKKLGIRSNQLFIGGNSAGGGLAVSTTIMARDKGEVQIAFQMPLFPMLDDRMETPSSQNNDAPVWDSISNKAAWKLYLGKLYGTDNIPSYAAAGRETNYSGLPPAYTFVGDIEPFYDETVAYIQKLRAAGVQAKLDVYPGCFHGFTIAFPKTPVSKLATQKYLAAFKAATESCFAPQ